MKSLSTFLLTALMVLSFSMLGFAQNMTAPAGPIGSLTYGSSGYDLSAAYGSQGGIGVAGSDIGVTGIGVTCATGELYTGEVAWADQNTHRMMVAGYEGNKIFDVSQAAMNGWPQTDHFVSVKYTVVNGEKVASSVTPISTKVAWLYTPIYG